VTRAFKLAPSEYYSEVERWEKWIAHHHELDETVDRLYHHLKAPGDRKNVFLVGPSGVGKTTAAQLLKKKVWENEPDLDSDEGRGKIPAIYVLLRHPTGGIFRFKELFEGALIDLNDPFVGNARRSEGELREAYIKALKKRKVRAVLIDEGATLTKATVPKGNRTVAEALMSLGDASKVVHYFFGTDQLSDLLFPTYQLNRRCRTFRFRHYDKRNSDDRSTLISVTETLLEQAPIPYEVGLPSKFVGSLFERTNGCIGTLHEWLLSAIRDAPTESMKKLTSGYLLQIADKYNGLDAEGAKQAADEIEDGIALYDSVHERFKVEPKIPTDTVTRAKAKISRRPGTRKPGRDPVPV
jgi:DNA polymerase III delta prime subunit